MWFSWQFNGYDKGERWKRLSVTDGILLCYNQKQYTANKRRMLKYLIISIRPKQWYKNSLLFVGMVFSLNFFNASAWIYVILAFIFFCMLSAGEYLINDILDIKRDRQHPIKRKRPIASGQLSVSYALLFAVLLIVGLCLGPI